MRTIPMVTLMLLLAGCAGSGAEGRASDAGWTTGAAERLRPVAGIATLEEVRAAAHPEFDRTVFQFSAAGISGYRVQYVDPPVRLCGSGEAVEISGTGRLSVRLEPAQAHDDRGKATVTDRERRPGLRVIRELRSTCDFEGQVEWVLGVAAVRPFRVLELSDPARLVVDVRR